MINKFKFRVQSSRMTDITEEYTLHWKDKNVPEDVIKDHLENWCREVFPMFDYTDGFVKYTYERII